MNTAELQETREEIRYLSAQIGREPIFFGNEPFPRAYLDPDGAHTDNEEGVMLETGEWVLLDDIDEAMREVGIPFHVFLREYEDFESPYFRFGATIAQGLWRFPKWDILATTHFDAISPAAREEGVEDLPYTTFRAFPHGTDDDLLIWVLGDPDSVANFLGQGKITP